MEVIREKVLENREETTDDVYDEIRVPLLVCTKVCADNSIE